MVKRVARDRHTLYIQPTKRSVRARVISVPVRRLRAYAVIHGLSQSMLLRQKEAKQNAGKHSA